MSKANDKVEWFFVKRMLRQLGFNDKWVSLIYHCISTVEYFVILNDGKDMGLSSRELRQDDPLNPYLFIIYVVGFARLLIKAR